MSEKEEMKSFKNMILLAVVVVFCVGIGYAFAMTTTPSNGYEFMDHLCVVNGYYGLDGVVEFGDGFMVTCVTEDLRFPQGLIGE